MVYFSEIKKCYVYDSDEKLLGILSDLIFRDGKKLAEITHLVIKDNENYKKKISWNYVKELFIDHFDNKPERITLNDEYSNVNSFFIKEEDMLVGDLIDKQVVDVDHVKVVRINDIALKKFNSKLSIVGVGVGKSSFLRRLGFSKLSGLIKDHIIPWGFVESLDKKFRDLHLNVQRKKISDLHTEEIADLMEDLPQNVRLMVFNSLNDKMAAKTLIGADSDVSSSLFRDIKNDKVLEILDEIPVNQAADILALLSTHRAGYFLSKMKKERASKIKKILNYRPDSAGSIMKTDVVTISPDETKEDVIDEIRAIAPSSAKLVRMYALDDSGKLLGYVSIKSLLLAKPKTKVIDLMETDIFSIMPNTSESEIAKIMARYDILVLPVTDSDGKLLGIVTADDIITKIIPERWNKQKFQPKRMKMAGSNGNSHNGFNVNGSNGHNNVDIPNIPNTTYKDHSGTK